MSKSKKGKAKTPPALSVLRAKEAKRAGKLAIKSGSGLTGEVGVSADSNHNIENVVKTPKIKEPKPPKMSEDDRIFASLAERFGVK